MQKPVFVEPARPTTSRLKWSKPTSSNVSWFRNESPVCEKKKLHLFYCEHKKTPARYVTRVYLYPPVLPFSPLTGRWLRSKSVQGCKLLLNWSFLRHHFLSEAILNLSNGPPCHKTHTHVFSGIQESLKLKMERTRKQNLKIYLKYKHIYYTGRVKYAIFTCLTTVQIFRKRQKTFLMQNHQLKRDKTKDHS